MKSFLDEGTSTSSVSSNAFSNRNQASTREFAPFFWFECRWAILILFDFNIFQDFMLFFPLDQQNCETVS